MIMFFCEGVSDLSYSTENVEESNNFETKNSNSQDIQMEYL